MQNNVASVVSFGTGLEAGLISSFGNVASGTVAKGIAGDFSIEITAVKGIAGKLSIEIVMNIG